MLITLATLFPVAVNGIAAKQAADKQSQTVVGVSSHLEVWCGALGGWAVVAGWGWGWNWRFYLYLFQNRPFQ